MQAPYMVMHLLSRFIPVNGAHSLIQHGSVGNRVRILGNPGHLSFFFKPAQGLAQQLRPQHRQTVKQFPGSLILPNGSFGNIDDIPRIHLPAQIHSRHAGLRQAVQHRPLIGGAAPILRQDAGVNVDATESGHIQHLLGQNPAVCHHGADVGLQFPQGFYRLLLPEVLGLKHGNPGSQRHFLHRGSYQLHAPALGTVGLGIDAHNLKTVRQYFFQTGRRNVRRSHEYNPHQSSSPASSSSVRNRSITSVYTMPSRWSSSWQKHRAINSSPSASYQLPFRSWARTLA